MSLSPADLARFEARQTRSLTVPQQCGLLAAAALFLGFFVWEWTSAPEVLPHTLPVRVGAAASLLALQLASRTVLRREPEVVLHLALCVSVTTVFWLAGVLPEGRLFTLGSLSLMVVFLGALSTSGWMLARAGLALCAVSNVVLVSAGVPGRELFVLDVFVVPSLMVAGVFAALTRRTRLESFALERRLEDQAQLDALSGALTRRAFEGLATLALQQGTASVLLLDVDHFKRINDSWGHAAGDAAIRAVGAVVRGQLRETDALGRVGGEEFAVLLPGQGEADALRVAERIRSELARVGYEARGERRTFTVSVGVAASRRGETYEEWLHRADCALYVAKRSGRDRVATLPLPA